MSIYPEVFVSITSQAIWWGGGLRNPNWDDNVIHRWKPSPETFTSKWMLHHLRVLGLWCCLLFYLDIFLQKPDSRNVWCLIPFFFLSCVFVICNFSSIFVFYSCFQNSQIQMSCFHTWILLICQAIAMMTFCLSLRTTETMCILPSFSLVHTRVAAQQGILTLLFHKRRKKTSQLDPMVHSLLSSSQNCFY